MAKKKQKPRQKTNPINRETTLVDAPLESSSNTYEISLLRLDRRQILFLSLLVIFGVIIYVNILQAPFVFDDQVAITENPLVRMQEITVKNMVEAATGYGINRPVPMLSFGFNYYFGEYNVLGYHLVNIFIHIINGILLYFLVKLTLTMSNRQSIFTRPLDPITITTLSFFTALLWLVNPVQTQSVTYIVQRMTSMGAMFYILALILYAQGRIWQQRSARKGDDRSRGYIWWFAGCFLAGLLAFGSKESTAMLPVFIFLYEWYFFQNLNKNWFKRRIKYLLAIAILFGFVAGLYLGFDPQGKFNTLRDYVFREFTIGERLLTQTRVVLYYLSLIFYPNPSRLNLDYDFPLSYSLFNPLTTLLSLIVIVGLIALGIYLAKKQRLISFCIFWFFGNLIIESSVIPLAIIFEHRIYIPSMFVFLLIVILLYRYIKPAWLTVVLVCALTVVSSYWTYERNKIWQDDLKLWMDCNKKSPNKARPYLNMGQILTNRKQYDEALPNYLKALQINPNFADANYNLGILFDKRDEPNKAIEHYRKAIELEPDFVKANNNLGVALLKQGLTEEAVIHFKRALKKDPEMAGAYVNLGLALSKQGELNAAIVQYNKALQISSNLPKAQFQLGAALVEQGRTEQGVHHLMRALEINPEYAEAHNDLGGRLLQEGKVDEALEHFNAALKTNPDIAEAHNNVGIIMVNKGRINEAVFHFQEALRINPEFELAQDNLKRALAIQQQQMDTETAKIQTALKANPDDPQLNYKLGNLYLGKGQFDKAITQFRKTLSIRPNFPPALNNLAMAYTLGGQYDQARAVFQQLVAIQPDNASNYYNVAVLYALQNRQAEALEWLNTAVAKGYDNWDLIKSDKDLESIRNSEGYKNLVEGH